MGTEKSDAKALQLAAHSLKSSSAYVGDMHLSALAQELEMTGRSGTLEGAREGEEKRREGFHLALKALETEITGSGQQQKPARKGKSYLLTILTVWP